MLEGLSLPKYNDTVTLGNILTIISMLGMIIYSFATLSSRFEDHIDNAKFEHEQFVRKEAIDMWRANMAESVAEMKEDIKEIKRAVK